MDFAPTPIQFLWEDEQGNRVYVKREDLLPYSFGGTKRLPDETFEDFDGIFALWCYEYTDEYKEKLRREFLERSKG